MEQSPPPAKTKPLSVVVVTADPVFLGAAIAAVSIASPPNVVASIDAAAPPADPSALSLDVAARAKRYTDKNGPYAVTLIHGRSLADAAASLTAAGTGGPVALVVTDTGADIESSLEAFYQALAAAAVPAVRAPSAVVAYLRKAPWTGGSYMLPDRWLVRMVSADADLLRAEMTCLFTDALEQAFDKPRLHKAALRDTPCTLATELTRFLNDRAGSQWVFHYYTSTSIMGFVDAAERAANEQGALALRAANEHALAAGAIADHLLYAMPFLMVVGSAMIDELRGTLANMRWAGARGFLVYPETELDHHYTFQGTISGDEDIREVLEAKRVPFVYIEKTAEIPHKLEEAFRLFEGDNGPVVVIVTHEVIDARDPLPAKVAYPDKASRPTELDPSQRDAFEKALAIVNRERTNVLFSCGRLTDEDRALVLSIAERAGIALADVFAHPGSVPAYAEGKRVPHYLGTLGLYGFNDRTYHYLHAGGKLRPKEEQCLFFLGSKLGQRATNFTPFRRAGLRMVQVTRRADHVAKDAEIAVVGEVSAFLRALSAGLDVDPEVKRHREEAIAAAKASPPGVTSALPSVPMSPSYFFRAMGALFARMIEEDGYRYTPVLDVGRSSVSALRAIPRTGPGFSGWYGRALMGDAPAALSTLAITAPSSLVAFAGDGAKAILADPVWSLLDNALAYPERVDKNITLFYVTNGTFSGIRMYRERLASKWGGRQMRALGAIDAEGDHDYGPLVVSRRTFTSFDGAAIREGLLAKRRLNIYTVMLGHSADDDGFTLVTSGGWQREV